MIRLRSRSFVFTTRVPGLLGGSGGRVGQAPSTTPRALHSISDAHKDPPAIYRHLKMRPKKPLVSAPYIAPFSVWLMAHELRTEADGLHCDCPRPLGATVMSGTVVITGTVPDLLGPPSSLGLSPSLRLSPVRDHHHLWDSHEPPLVLFQTPSHTTVETEESMRTLENF